MKKKNIKPLVLSALTALAMGAVGTVGTFALFTDKAETTINIGSGKVDVTQSLSITSVSELGGVAVAASDGVYVNSIGGTTKINSDGELVLEKWAPGDKAVIEITNKNFSDVMIKTRFVVSHTSTSNPDLWNALTVSYEAVDANNNNINHKFMDWSVVDPSTATISKVRITIEFKDHDNGEIRFGDDNLDNRYQNCNCRILFTQEAVQANAQTNSLIDQLNYVLDSSAGKNNTLHDTIAELQAANDQDWGETLLKNNVFLWNSETDHLVYRDEAVFGEEYKYFKICDEMPSEQVYSVYASSSWSGAEVDLTGIGFDAGDASGITAISYIGGQSARENIIRTNSLATAVTVNAPNDTIHHYGTAGTLNIVAVANNSYHENGKVAFVEIAKGRIALEKTAEVSKVHLTAISANEGFDEIIIAKDAEAAKPEFTRDAVTIPVEGRLVVALQETTDAEAAKDYVWLNSVGVYEQITVSDSKEEAGSTWVNTSDKSDDTKDTAKEIANNIAVTVGSTSYTVQATGEERSSYVLVEADTGEKSDDYTVDSASLVVTETQMGEVTTVTTTAAVVVKDASTDETVVNTAKAENGTNFAGGKGTQANPYVIPTEDWWMKFVDLCKDDNDFSETAGKYFKVLTDLDLTSKQVRANIHYFAGSIDFDNHVFTGLTPVNAPATDVPDTDCITAIFSLIHGEVSISNLRFATTKIVNGSHTVAAQVAGINSGNVDVTYENITMSGSVTGTNINNNGLLLSYIWYGTANITIKNVDNYANLIGTGYKSAYLGNMGYGNVLTIDISGCDNFGTIVSTNAEAAMFIANPGYPKDHDIIVTIDNCSNQGNICQPSSYSRNNLFITRIDSHYRYIVNGMNLSQCSNADFNAHIASDLTGDLVNSINSSTLATKDGEFVLVPVTDAVRYELSFSFYAGGMAAGGGAGYTMRMTPDQLAEAHVKVYDWIEKSAATDPIVEHTEYVNPYYTSGEHYVFNADNMTIRDNVLVTLTAYGANDALLSIATYTYAS